MSRPVKHSDTARSGRFQNHQLPFHKRATSSQTSSTPPKISTAVQPFNPRTPSHKNQSYSHFKHQFSGRTTSANLNPLNQISDLSSEEDQEEGFDELHRRSIQNIKLGIPTLSMQTGSTPARNNLNNKSISGNGSGGRRRSNGGAGGSGGKRKGRNAERKASVRKQDYDLEEVLGILEDDDDGGDSDLTDVPSMDAKGGNQSEQGPNSDSDSEMEAKLKAAGDGESLLGSANSDQDSDEEIEEEQYIIEDTLLREAKARARAQQSGRVIGGGSSFSRGRGSGHGRGAKNGSSSQRNKLKAMDEDGQDADEEDGNDEADDETDGAEAAPSWSPQDMKLGLPLLDQDELFEEQEGFNSSSEPSFTDFFASSDEEDSNARDDDDESTDDDLGGSEDEISDLDGGILGAPFLAHFTTTQDGSDLLNGLTGRQGGDLVAAAKEGNNNGSNDPSSLANQAEVPLLVIEDLDGRLIYARAGDGEAVFGSDGEFEFVDDSDEDDSEDEMTFRDPVRRRSGPGVLDADTWRELGVGPSDVGEDSGDTTDELPDEDMPFPRLLVGSVAPHGGRAARRARAMAAKSRLLSPSGGNTPRGRQRSREHSSSVGSRQNEERAVSMERLASSESNDIDQIIPETKNSNDQEKVQMQVQNPSSSSNKGSGAAEAKEPSTPESKEKDLPGSSASEFPKPEMGSFMPASAKSVHRAVIDGSHKAPSPFASRLALQSRGLSRKRNQRRDSTSTQSSKRPRRFSLDGTSHGNGTASEAPSSPERALHSASEAPAEISAMDLDDVVEASMLWRGDRSISPSADEDLADQTEQEVDSDLGSVVQLESSTMRVTPANEARRLSKGKGKDIEGKGKGKSKSKSKSKSSSLSAFARWDKIPLGAFRDTQSSRGGASSRNRESQGPNGNPGQSSSHRLGTFLLTATGTRSGTHHSAESSFSATKRSARQNQESSPFRGRREARTGEEALSFALGGNTLLDLERARAATSSGGNGNRDATFIVSPVLFPVRHRRSSGGLGPQDPDDDIAAVRLPEAFSPSGQSSVKGEGDTDMDLGGGSRRRPDLGPGRITKREKREKRARKAAAQLQIQIALAAQAEMAQQQLQSRSNENGSGTTAVTPPVNEGNEKKESMGSSTSSLSQSHDDSPAASLAMPRLSITDASPRSSPSVQASAAPMPKRFQREGIASLKGSNSTSNSLVAGPLSPNTSMPPPSSTAPSTSNCDQNSSQERGDSLPPVQASPVLRPPSSSFGGPLHSPLFGGIGMYGGPQGDEGDGEGEQVAALSI